MAASRSEPRLVRSPPPRLVTSRHRLRQAVRSRRLRDGRDRRGRVGARWVTRDGTAGTARAFRAGRCFRRGKAAALPVRAARLAEVTAGFVDSGGRGGGSGPEEDADPLPAPASGAGTSRDSRRPPIPPRRAGAWRQVSAGACVRVPLLNPTRGARPPRGHRACLPRDGEGSAAPRGTAAPGSAGRCSPARPPRPLPGSTGSSRAPPGRALGRGSPAGSSPGAGGRGDLRGPRERKVAPTERDQRPVPGERGRVWVGDRTKRALEAVGDRRGPAVADLQCPGSGTQGLPGASSWAGDLLERKSAIRFSEPKERFYCRQVQRSACFSVSTSHFICDVGLSRPTSLEIEGFAGPQSSSTYSYFSFPAVRQGRYFPAQAAMIHQLIKTQRCAAAGCQLK